MAWGFQVQRFGVWEFGGFWVCGFGLKGLESVQR